MNTKTHILLLEYLKMQLMKLLVEEMAVSVKTVATVHSSCKTETHAADEIQCNERRVLSPEQVKLRQNWIVVSSTNSFILQPLICKKESMH